MHHHHRARFGRRGFLARMGVTTTVGASGLVLPGRGALGRQATPAADAPPITHRQVETNGISMHIAEAGEGPLVVMIHGFPEMWYSWRHQLPALAAAGYHAVAPDMRGVGETDAPPDVESYSLRNQMADILGLMDALGEERAVLVGHDTGAGTTWALTELYPERIAAHVTLGIGYAPRSEEPPTEMIRKFAPGMFNYAIYFQEPGVAEAEFEADVRRSLLLFMYGISGDAPDGLLDELFTQKPDTMGALDGVPEPERPLDWLTDEELDVYTAAYEKTGFTGALNVYRNFDRDWREVPEAGTLGVRQPALFVGGKKDPAVYFTQDWIDPMIEVVPNLDRIVLLPHCGHWIQQERPDDLNAELIDFLRRDSSL